MTNHWSVCIDLPDALEPWCLSKKNPASARHDMWKGLYGRLNFEGRFQTQLTEMSPMGKQGVSLFSFMSHKSIKRRY